MTEDFNEAPVAIEDKHFLVNFINESSLKIEQIECAICKYQFSNSNIENQSLIISHLKEFSHNSINIINKNNPSNKVEIKCSLCAENNVFKLNILIKSSETKNALDIRNIIFCKKHSPIGFQTQSILDIIELDEITKRKLNKVQLKYKNKNNYYEIFKPLLIADMIYTRKVYDNKLEFDIELQTKGQNYYFEISQYFTEINFAMGRVLKFTEQEKEYVDEEEENESENEQFTFLGVIVNITISEKKYNDEDIYKIWIMPINKHITSLKGHKGQYKIKEEFCTIPYQRMLEALDIFVNDFPDDENEIFDRAVSLYLTRRIMGDFPSNKDINNDKDGKIHEKWKEYLRIELNSLKHVLFEEDTLSHLETSIDDFGELNQSQISALRNVFSSVLNLIQGPPGTGKTFLSSFIAYNIFKFRKNKEEKLLLCSPSNSAADNLASNLIKLNKAIGKKMKILRIYAKSRELLEQEEEISKISLHKILEEKLNEENIIMTNKEILSDNIEKIVNNVDIVISTCSNAWDERINKYSFPFVIIDEATQSCEIESLIAVAHGCRHLTLIGDQKQLGSVILHPKANKTGMNISMFERILKLYPDLLNMLTIQYRMNAEIVKFPSSEFYENKIINGHPLKERINKEFNKKFNWPIKDIPLMFIHNDGEEDLIESGKSKKNEEEAILVTLFVKKLINCGIDFNDIGIITPYTAQKILIQTKLKEIFKNSKIENLKISSVDGFQGREKNYIILSNVRSNENNEIGFVKDFRRLNVSITRAKYGMIIIGNAKCLYHNKCVWKNFINYYQEEKLLYIPEIKIKDNEEKEYNLDNLKNINIGNEKNEDLGEIYKEYDFNSSGNKPGINQDLLDNFECQENVYLQGNKKHINKKKNKKKKEKIRKE